MLKIGLGLLRSLSTNKSFRAVWICLAAIIIVFPILSGCGGKKTPSQATARAVQKATPPPEPSHVPSWRYETQMLVGPTPQFFSYLDRVEKEPGPSREVLVRDFSKREYAVVEERVLTGRSNTVVFKDLKVSNNIFILICEGEKPNLKYSIALNQTNNLWHTGLVYDFPVVMVKGPVTYFHHVNIGFIFFHDEEGASLNSVKQPTGYPILKDGTKVTILRLRPTLFGIPM